LWDRRSDSAVYGIEFATKIAVESCAQRLNEIYRQFLKDGAARPEKPAKAIQARWDIADKAPAEPVHTLEAVCDHGRGARISFLTFH
jgi:hypothetical protein